MLCYSLLTLVIASIAIDNVDAQFVSPCPDLFMYEPQAAEKDKWYATLTILSNTDLSGVWLRIVLDKPSIQLGNWFGEVVTQDNIDYLVKNPRYMVEANMKYKVRFFIKYNPEEPPPRLMSFRLNAKTVCPPLGSTTAAAFNGGQSNNGQQWSTTPSSPLPTVPASSGVVTPSSFSGYKPPPGNDEDDFFQGDFAIFNRPSNPVITRDTENCGTVVQPSRPQSHGQETHELEFPWNVALYVPKGIDLTFICGATLISRFHVITVAHCVCRRKSHQPLSPENLIVYLGKYYLKRWSTAGIQDKGVEKITAHPQYNAQTFANDIAIVRLADPVEVTNYVRPVCLWDGDQQLNAVVNKAGTVVGWGFNENGQVTDKLTKARMPVVSQETCVFSFPDFYSRFTSSKTFCAGFENGTSTCNGHSGGGLVFPKATSSPTSPVWQLRGLVSISVALQNQLKCDASRYVIFTDVAQYLDWIKANLN